MNEAETCRTMVRPILEAAGWKANGERHYREQIGITAGRIVVAGGRASRLKKKIPDFLLCFTRDVVLGVVEAKSAVRPATDGLQQAKDYATTLGLMFAFATNGAEVVEYDFFTHIETVWPDIPSPTELWQRYQQGTSLSSAVRDAMLDKYPDHGVGEFEMPNVLQVPPLSSLGTPAEITGRFGGVDQLLAAVDRLQEYLYAA